jgi:hypothetical protein
MKIIAVSIEYIINHINKILNLNDRPTLIGSYIISENTLVKILNIEQFIIYMSEILYIKCKQYGIPYCGTEHVMCMY